MYNKKTSLTARYYMTVTGENTIPPKIHRWKQIVKNKQTLKVHKTNQIIYLIFSTPMNDNKILASLF